MSARHSTPLFFLIITLHRTTTERRILSVANKTEIDDLNEQMKDYQSKGYNIPGTTVVRETADFMKPVIRLVRIDTDAKQGEIYEASGSKFAFGRPAIQKFADAGRIELRIPKDGTRIERGPNLERYVARVVGERYDLDGALKRLEDEKSLDLVVRSEELYNKNSDKVEKEHPKWSAEQKKDYVDRYITKVMIEKRKFAMEMAVTGAQARVVTKMLGLKPAYTIEELRKPFVIIAVSLVVNMKDPDMKRMVTQHMLGIRETIYPQHSSSEFTSRTIESPEVSPANVDTATGMSVTAGKKANISDNFEDYPRAMREAIVLRLPGAKTFTGQIGGMSDPELRQLYGTLKEAA